MNNLVKGLITRALIAVGVSLVVLIFTLSSVGSGLSILVMWGLWLPVMGQALIGLHYGEKVFYDALYNGTKEEYEYWYSTVYDTFPTWRKIAMYRRAAS